MITILSIPLTSTGKGYYRIKQPLQHLSDKNKDFLTVERRPGNLRITKDDVKHADIIYTNGISPNILNLFTSLKKQKADVKIIYDIDDWDWNVPEYNPVYKMYKKRDAKSLIRNILASSDTIISSTPQIKQGLLDEFGKIGQSEVIRIGIDYEYLYWNQKSNRDTINVGWIGGAAHIKDLKLIKGIGSWVVNNFKNTKFVLGGWNSMIYTNSNKNIYHEDKYNIWYQYKQVLFDKPYNKSKLKILRSLPTYLYPQMFKEVDILLCPLVKNDYNEAKSRIKLIESSAYNVVPIASNIKPYNIALQNNKNGKLINNTISLGDNSTANINDWKEAITDVIKNEEKRKSMAKQLNQDLRPIHHIDVQNEKRKEILKETLNKKG